MPTDAPSSPDAASLLTSRLEVCRQRRGSIIRRFVISALAGLFLAGCAIQYRDADGVRHMLGLAHVSFREAPAARSHVVAQQVSTIGAAILILPEQSGVALGYTRTFTIQVESSDEAGKLRIPLSNAANFSFTDYETLKRELE